MVQIMYLTWAAICIPLGAYALGSGDVGAGLFNIASGFACWFWNEHLQRKERK